MGVSAALGSSALLPAGLGFRNVLINGGMQVAQRSSSVAVITASSYYTADRWYTNADGTIGTWTQSIVSDAPADSGLASSLKMLCNIANPSLDAADFLAIDQRIEGQNLYQFGKGTSSAKPFTVSFWVKSNVTGNYVVELRDVTNARSVGVVYNVGSSATWEKKTVTFPADTTGAFANDNSGALRLGFGLAMGSTYTSGTLNTVWGSATAANRWVGQTNVSAAVNNYWQVTGVQLEQNYQPTPFEQRPIGAELQLCQRYFISYGGTQVYEPVLLGMGQSAGRVDFQLWLPVEMRTSPSAAITGNWQISDSVSAIAVTGLTASSPNTGNKSTLIIANVASGVTTYRAYRMEAANSTASRLQLSAEL